MVFTGVPDRHCTAVLFLPACVFSGALFRLAWAGAAFAIPVSVILAEKENAEPAYDGFSQTIDTAYIGGAAAFADVSAVPQKEPPQKAAAGLASGRRGMVAHVLLLLTFGIYGFVWIYQTTESLIPYIASAKNSRLDKTAMRVFIIELEFQRETGAADGDLVSAPQAGRTENRLTIHFRAVLTVQVFDADAIG